MSIRGMFFALNSGVDDPMAKLALMAICDVEEGGESYVSISSIDKWACCGGNEEMVFECLKYLRDSRLIIYERAHEGASESHLEISIFELIAESREEKANVRKSIPLKVRAEVYARDGFTCKYCQSEIEEFERSIDHVIPQSRGGSNEIDNLVVCCLSCNSSKGARTPQEWGAVRQ